MAEKLKIGAAGGILFLLPFFVIPFNGDMQMQFDVPKLMGAYLLGNLCFAFVLARASSFYLGLAHLGFSWITLLSGFGSWQLHPFAFYLGGLFFSLWWVTLPEASRVLLLRLIAVSGCLVALQAYAQTMHFTWPLQYGEGIDNFKPIAFIGQHTKLGAYLAPIAALCLALGWYPACAFVVFVCALTGSSFTAAALIAGLLIAARFKLGRRMVINITALGLAASVALFLLFPKLDMFAGNGRMDVWRETVACAAERPVTGFGPGGFATLFADHCESVRTRELNGRFFQAHNDFLQVLFDFGRAGVVVLLVVLFGIFRAYFHTWWRFTSPHLSVRCAQGMLAALMVNAVGNFPFQLAPHFLLGMSSAAILLQDARAAVTIFPWQPPIYLRLLSLQTKCARIWARLMTFPKRKLRSTSTGR